MKKILLMIGLLQVPIMTFAADSTEQFNALKHNAEKGNSNAQFELGLAYEEGKIVEENDDLAILWYLKSAEQNNATAQQALSDLYLEKHQYQNAVKWLKILSSQGYSYSTAELAKIYEQVRDYKNDDLQFKYYQLAVEQGDDDSLEKLALLYLSGIGVEKNIPIAIKLLKQASENAVGNSTAILGTIYLKGEVVPRNFKLAKQYLEQALVEGDQRVYAQLAELHVQGGFGIEKNIKKSEYYSLKNQENIENQERMDWGR